MAHYRKKVKSMEEDATKEAIATKKIKKSVQRASPDKTIMQQIAKEVTMPKKVLAPNELSVLKKASVNTQSDAEKVVLEILASSKGTPLTRKEIMATASIVPNRDATMLHGKPRWEVNVNWAIHRLKNENTIGRLARNQYVLGATRPIQSTPMAKPARKRVIVKNAVINTPTEVKVENATWQPTEVVVEGMKQPQEAPEMRIEHKEIQSTGTEKADENMEELEIIHPNASQYYLREAPKNYVPNKKFETIFQSMLDGNAKPIILKGAAGVSKTSSVRYFANKSHTPIITVQGNPNTGADQLVGYQTMVGENKIKFVLGSLPTAIEVANQEGKAILLIDEINAIKPQWQKLLNSFDERMEVEVPELGGKKFALRPGAKLVVIGTMNPIGLGYGGGNELNRELKGRFGELEVPYPTPQKELQILSKSTADESLAKQMILLASFTRKSNEADRDFYALSPRDLTYTLESYEAYKKTMDKKMALELALELFVINRYDDSVQKLEIERQVKSILANFL